MRVWRSATARGIALVGGVIQTPSMNAKLLNALGKCLADDDRDFGLCGSLVVAELGEPGIAPVFRSFEFPEDSAALLGPWAHDAVQHLPSMLAVWHRIDCIAGELSLQERFQLQLQHLSRKRLRALLRPAFQVFDLLPPRTHRRFGGTFVLLPWKFGRPGVLGRSRIQPVFQELHETFQPLNIRFLKVVNTTRRRRAVQRRSHRVQLAP